MAFRNRRSIFFRGNTGLSSPGRRSSFAKGNLSTVVSRARKVTVAGLRRCLPDGSNRIGVSGQVRKRNVADALLLQLGQHSRDEGRLYVPAGR